MTDHVIRSIQLPIERVDDDTWKLLRAIAAQTARYGNRMLAGQYVMRSGVFDEMLELFGVEDKAERRKLRTAFQSRLRRDENDEIGCEVRAAMERRCQATWQRSGKLILRGSERLACYSADRALSIRATGHRGGVNFVWDGDTPCLDCKLQPQSTHDPVRLRVALESTRARKDWYIRSAVQAIWGGDWRPGQVTIRFDRMRKKLDVKVSVRVPREQAEEGEAIKTAALGPLDEYGQLRLRFDGGSTSPPFPQVEQMRRMKDHMDGIKKRIQRTIGRGKGRRRTKRDLLARQSFEQWAAGPVHQLSRAIIDMCRKVGVATLVVTDFSDGDLPWSTLKFQLAYKGEEVGIHVVETEESTPAMVRAKKRRLQKEAQKARRAKEGLQAVREFMH